MRKLMLGLLALGLSGCAAYEQLQEAATVYTDKNANAQILDTFESVAGKGTLRLTKSGQVDIKSSTKYATNLGYLKNAHIVQNQKLSGNSLVVIQGVTSSYNNCLQYKMISISPDGKMAGYTPRNNCQSLSFGYDGKAMIANGVANIWIFKDGMIYTQRSSYQTGVNTFSMGAPSKINITGMQAVTPIEVSLGQ